MPHAVSAQGACSRDEPAPEVVARQQDLAALHLGLVEDEVRVGRAVGQVAPVVEQGVGEARLLGRLEEPRRDDLVGVDVLGGQRDERCCVNGSDSGSAMASVGLRRVDGRRGRRAGAGR